MDPILYDIDLEKEQEPHSPIESSINEMINVEITTNTLYYSSANDLPFEQVGHGYENKNHVNYTTDFEESSHSNSSNTSINFEEISDNSEGKFYLIKLNMS